MRISTNDDSSVMLKPKKKKSENPKYCYDCKELGKKQNRDHEMEQYPLENLAMHEGDNPSL